MSWIRRPIADGLVALALVAGCQQPPSSPATRSESANGEPAAEVPSTQSPPLTRREPAAPVTSLETTTDDAGRFQLRNLAPGGYRVTFGEPTESRFTTIDGVQVNAIYGANLLDLRLHSEGDTTTLRSDEYQPNKLPGVIRGNVVDAGGAPIQGVRVRAEQR